MNEGTSNRLSENILEDQEIVSTAGQEQDVESTQHSPEQSPNRSTEQRNNSQLSLRNCLNAFTSYVLSSEDDVHLQRKLRKNSGQPIIVEREPMFVIVDSSGLSDPSSRELLIDKRSNCATDFIFSKFLSDKVLPNDFPSTSRAMAAEMFQLPQLMEADSTDERQMVDINLQSDHEILVNDNDDNDQSLVISYIRSKDVTSNIDGTLLSTKKKPSLLESVPKLETILEDRRLSAFSQKSEIMPNFQSQEEDKEE